VPWAFPPQLLDTMGAGQSKDVKVVLPQEDGRLFALLEVRLLSCQPHMCLCCAVIHCAKVVALCTTCRHPHLPTTPLRAAHNTQAEEPREKTMLSIFEHKTSPSDSSAVVAAVENFAKVS
jgi:hypothetical protein